MELLEKIAMGDIAAQGRFYSEYRDFVYYAAYARCNDQYEAAKATRGVFNIAFERLTAGERVSEANISQFLLSILQGRANEHVRHEENTIVRQKYPQNAPARDDERIMGPMRIERNLSDRLVHVFPLEEHPEQADEGLIIQRHDAAEMGYDSYTEEPAANTEQDYQSTPVIETEEVCAQAFEEAAMPCYEQAPQGEWEEALADQIVSDTPRRTSARTKKKQHKGSAVGIICIILLLLCLVGVFLWVLYSMYPSQWAAFCRFFVNVWSWIVGLFN